MCAQIRTWLLALLMVWALSHTSVFGDTGAPAGKDQAPSPAEKIRKALDQTMVLDYTGQSFQDVLQHLKEKTKVSFVLDLFVLQQMGLGLEETPQTIHLKADRHTKVRVALQRLLRAHNLTYVILEDSVLVTTEEMGLQRQMRQRVSIDVTNEPLTNALQDLARKTAFNLVIDPRSAKEAEAKVSLQLDDASLETTVRLLAELGSLKSVRVGNVLFITSEARADKLRKEEPAYPLAQPDFPNGIGQGMVFPRNRGFGGGLGGLPGAPPGLPPPPALDLKNKQAFPRLPNKPAPIVPPPSPPAPKQIQPNSNLNVSQSPPRFWPDFFKALLEMSETKKKALEQEYFQIDISPKEANLRPDIKLWIKSEAE